MEKVQFQVEIKPALPTSVGADLISFRFSPNPGEALQPLSGTASGGEMSRFLLALKACFSQVDPVGSLIFDEIDVGVSGRVAQAIAEKLHQLSLHHQVLCVTHQPIIAAMADSHFRVEKQVVEQARRESKSTGRKTKLSAQDIAASQLTSAETALAERTVIRVSALDAQQRQEELAQLAGGRSVEDAIKFAISLLNQADALRQS
jgi:DNA repair protein RecN (Recombination protein N)